MKKPSENKESSKEKNKTPGQTTSKDSAYIVGFGAGLPTSKPGQLVGLPVSLTIPRASSSGVALDKTTVVLPHVTRQGQDQIKVEC